MIHLIGVEHKVQCKNPNWGVTQAHRDNWDRYSSIIEESLRTFQPSAVAEELNQEILDRKNGAMSILQSVKENHEARTGTKIQHIFAEPDSAAKSAKGYKEPERIKAILRARIGKEPTCEQVMAHVVAHQHRIREALWLESVSDYLRSEMLFVCGDIHLYTFPKLLEREGIPYKVFASRVGVGNLKLPEYRGLEYAQSNNMLGEPDCICLQS